MDCTFLDKLEEKAIRSLEELAESQSMFSPGEVESAKEAVCLLKEIDELRWRDGYDISMRGSSRRMWDGGWSDSWNDGMIPDSYSGAGRSRDTMGRYSSAPRFGGRSFTGMRGSNRDYSGHDADNTAYDLEMLINSTNNEADKRVLTDALSRIQDR